MQSLCVLGRQPALGAAELESLYGSESIELICNREIALVKLNVCDIAFDRLGGSIKLATILATIDTTKWQDIEDFLVKEGPVHAKDVPSGKLNIGLSTFGLDVNTQRLSRTGLALKKAIKMTGKSVRIVPNNSLVISSAQVIYNKLTSPNGWELVLVRNNDQTIIAQTVQEQDINSYSLRDRSRPKRDSRVGMLPPKLAQIIINLAVGPLDRSKLPSKCEVRDDEILPQLNFGQIILDPFCGTGVILQEGLLMGYEVEGSDLDERMVEYSETNLNWLFKTYKLSKKDVKLNIGDATSYIWQNAPKFVASETYLGQAFTRQPSDGDIAENIRTTNLIIKKTLQNLAKQLSGQTRLCLAIPAFRDSRGEFHHLPLIDSLDRLGYNRISFKHLDNSQLIYYREQQVVARELVIITRK